MFWRKAVSLICILCLMLCVMPVERAEAWNVPDFVDDVYEITNLDELFWFASQVNGGNTGINGKLMADIVVNKNVLSEDGTLVGNDYMIWTPIGFCVPGDVQRMYTGTFDGNGKTISGLYFGYDLAENLGLFGCIGPGGMVMNLTVADSYLMGGRFVGGVAGVNGGTIRNCMVDASVIAMEDGAGGVAGVNFGNIDRCGNSGHVNGGGNDVGGLAGSNSGCISNCFNIGSVYADGFCAGGVVGFNGGMVISCFNTGNVIEGATQGGIAGGNNGTVENCYYLSGSAAVSEDGVAQSKAEFASGQVCFLLQSEQEDQVWGQKIGKEAWPGFSENKVFEILDEGGYIIGYENAPKVGVTVSGSISSYLTDGEIFVELLLNGEVVDSNTLQGMNVNFALEGVEAGTYELCVSKQNHISRVYQVIVAEEDLIVDVKICPIGDVTGDGNVNIKDFQRLLRHVNKTNPLTDYELACGDVTGDGVCNIKDFQRLLRHVNKTNPLF